ncbi:hypothetical protein [Oceanobacter mangrovi]|uniref:hypothetical protein n=1 Tax=Oceanobacter mangrovi TaxID=2862510 RepID=UPI001C8ED966|nr:hypothetical protein [Oceanobacter mangrovi]
MANNVKKILNPPAGEIGLHQVRKNLHLIHQALGLPDSLAQALEELDAMAENETRGSSWAIDTSVSADSRMHGYINDHPAWAAMLVCNEGNRTVMLLQHRLLEALVDPKSIDFKSHDVAGFGRLIRKCGKDQSLTLPPKQTVTLATVESMELPDTEIADALRFLKVLDGEKVVRRGAHTKNPHHRTSSPREGITRGRFGNLVELLPPDEEDPGAHPGILEFFPHESLAFRPPAGLAHGEDHPADQILILLEKLQGQSIEIKTARQKSESARAILARVNAALPLTYSQLTDSELQKIWQLAKQLRQKQKTKFIGIALVLMLATSTKIEDLGEMCLADAQSASENLSFDEEKNVFLVPRIRPEYRTPEPAPVTVKMAKHILYSSPSVEIPNVLLQPSEVVEFIRHVAATNPEQLKKSVKSALSTLNSTRITCAKISRCLFEIARSSFDPVIVQTTFGIRVPSANTPQFYSAVSDRDVAICFFDSLNQLLQRLDEQPIWPLQIKHSGFFAARHVPTTDEMAAVIQAIAEDAQHFQPGSVEWHNANTLLAILVQSICTSVRGVFDPLVEIDQESGFLFFRDKDKPDYSHARFQPVHPLAIKISDFYCGVRRATFAKIGLQKNGVAYFSFFRGEGGRIISPNPKNIESHLRHYTRWPLNSNRKFLKNKLRNLGVDADAINVAMNHHSQGEAMWDQFSTTDPVIVKKQLLKAFDEIIDELGIQEEWFDVV